MILKAVKTDISNTQTKVATNLAQSALQSPSDSIFPKLQLVDRTPTVISS